MSDSTLRAIVGLGNPGLEHSRTRHNAGFWFVDALARSCEVAFRAEHKFQGDLAKATIAGESVLLFKPSTFMNRSGEAIGKLIGFYKIAPEEILVVHDELDLPAGVARLKQGGGHGGHNGLRSVHEHIGDAYMRLRIGIAHPGTKDKVLGHVLGRPNATDEENMLDAIGRSLDVLPVLIHQGLAKAMNQLHTKAADEEETEK
ncbi:MAG TPA: aminoacyl-tRNA hydrolase [Nevskiaceae bacterium]|nr:aminoacyl-tRNA hydrolase [Nevskiaceae bacterium]